MTSKRAATLSRTASVSVLALLASCYHYEQHSQSSVQMQVQVTPPPTLVQELPAGMLAQGLPVGVLPTVPRVPLDVGAALDVPTMHALLDNVGSWRTVESLGTIWIPEPSRVGQDFTPYYSDGRWMPTDRGWYWQSYQSWGWVTFHYGRWVPVAGQWGWAPGSAFAPAWVNWRTGGSWSGWAPMPPEGMAVRAPYTFCRTRDLSSPASEASDCVHGPAALGLYASTQELGLSLGPEGLQFPAGPVGLPGAGPVVSLNNAWRAELAWLRSEGTMTAEVGGPAPERNVPALASAEPLPPAAPALPAAPLRLRESVSLGYTYDDHPGARGGGGGGGGAGYANSGGGTGYGSAGYGYGYGVYGGFRGGYRAGNGVASSGGVVTAAPSQVGAVAAPGSTGHLVGMRHFGGPTGGGMSVGHQTGFTRGGH